ncbi:hypothetical protein Tco_0866076, partial [Tanacetum coccineum]
YIDFSMGGRLKLKELLFLTRIALAIEVHDSNDVLGYWLFNTSTLLTLLQHTLKASGAAQMSPQRRRSSSASLLWRCLER